LSHKQSHKTCCLRDYILNTLEAENMLIDDKLRKVLMRSAEEFGISDSILLDWCALNEGDIFASVALKALRDGIVEIAGIRNQQPVFKLTEQGKRVADLRLKESAAKEFSSKPLASRSRVH